MRILMVCLGNICRSPLAEGILRDKVRRAHLDWFVDSAGTGSYHTGEAPHFLSQKVARENGIDISRQKARKFVKEDFDRFDKIYVMDEQNYREVMAIGKEKADRTKVEYLMNELFPGENKPVPDPWYGGEADFFKVFGLINAAVSQIIGRYQR